MNLELAKPIAERLVEIMAPWCERIQIAGSIRRDSAIVGDIEIVCISKPRTSPIEFGKPAFKTELDAQLWSWVERREPLVLLPREKGDRHKGFYLPNQSIKLDLFIVSPPAQWGVILAIRTGDKDFSKTLVTQRSKGGCLPNGYFVQNGAVWGPPTDGTLVPAAIPMPEELDFLEFLGLGWIEPSKRVPRWGMFSQ